LILFCGSVSSYEEVVYKRLSNYPAVYNTKVEITTQEKAKKLKYSGSSCNYFVFVHDVGFKKFTPARSVKAEPNNVASNLISLFILLVCAGFSFSFLRSCLPGDNQENTNSESSLLHESL
jgi:hypothetical protein